MTNTRITLAEYDKALEYFRRHTLDLKREYCPEYQEENA